MQGKNGNINRYKTQRETTEIAEVKGTITEMKNLLEGWIQRQI